MGFFRQRVLKEIVASKSRMVFYYQNCSNLLWKKNCSSDRDKLLKFKAENLQTFWDH